MIEKKVLLNPDQLNVVLCTSVYLKVEVVLLTLTTGMQGIKHEQHQ